MTALLVVEARRALARRLTRVLILAALLATVIAGIAVFINAPSANANGQDPRLHLTLLWPNAGGEDGILAVTTVFLELTGEVTR